MTWLQTTEACISFLLVSALGWILFLAGERCGRRLCGTGGSEDRRTFHDSLRSCGTRVSGWPLTHSCEKAWLYLT